VPSVTIKPGKNLVFISPSDPEWDSGWAALAAEEKARGYDINNCTDYPDGEYWKYVGTERHDGNWFHCFRIYAHPETGGERDYFSVPAPKKWKPSGEQRQRAVEYVKNSAPVGQQIAAPVEAGMLCPGDLIYLGYDGKLVNTKEQAMHYFVYFWPRDASRHDALTEHKSRQLTAGSCRCATMLVTQNEPALPKGIDHAPLLQRVGRIIQSTFGAKWD